MDVLKNAAIFPLVLTAVSPTVCRILYGDSPTRSIKSAVTLVFFTYIIPCAWLWGIHQSNAIGESTATAIFTAVLLSPVARLLSQWPKLLSCLGLSPQANSELNTTANSLNSAKDPPNSYQRWIDLAIKGGPLGFGCHKVMHVISAYLLWMYVRGFLPPTIPSTIVALKYMKYALQPSSLHGWVIVCLVVAAIGLLSVIVNAVLWAWSRYCRDKNVNHDGLNAMLQSTMGRSLRTIEHFQLFFLALINATCEEFLCRGFWRYELELTAGCSEAQSNIIQGMIFGMWHYFGIPSGWTGVVLTTVYGWGMGFLSNWKISNETASTTGLLFPIITHCIADYYIFTVIARQSNAEKALRKGP